SIGGDVYTVSLSGGTPSNATPDFKGSFRGIDWRGTRIVGGAIMDDRFAVLAIDPQARTTRTLRSVPVTARTQETNNPVAFSADGTKAALIQEDFNRAFAIAAGPVSKLAAITHENDKLAKNVSVKSVHWTNDTFH